MDAFVVTVAGNGYSDTISNHGPYCLHFTYC